MVFSLVINGKKYDVGGNFGPSVTLNEFIRNVAELRGTKAMCHEGGCGACIVAVKVPIPPNNVVKTFAVNSCLVSVLSCHGWEVITVEGIGNRIKGYHDIQSRLAKFNGTQCGYCTPGWVMSMYSLYQSKNKNLTSEEIENSFASNLCRCTGYRPIADAFKTFASDAEERLLDKLMDLEDLSIMKPCGLECANKCGHRDKCFKDNINSKTNDTEFNATDEETDDFVLVNDDKTVMIEADSFKWFKVYNLANAFTAMRQGDYKLIAGNTGQGVYHVSKLPPVIIDIFNVGELKSYSLGINLVLGAGMTLSEMMELFARLSKEREEFSYLKELYNHMDLVAHIPVRNIGTIGGNLYLKHCHNEFQSDLFLLFETVGAIITIAEAVNIYNTMKLKDFLSYNMKGKIIKNILLPPLSQSCFVKTYKIMPRSQNAHAVVNAGFLLQFKENTNLLEKVSIVYGGISPSFVHASKTENLLVNKDPCTDATLQLALKSLYEEIFAVEMPTEPSAGYRKMLAVTLYYKAILSLCPNNRMNAIYKSGAEVIKRGTSRGTQIFETDESVWPLNKPIPKVEALVQCSGEAIFANDMPAQATEVFAAFVTADVVPGSVIKDFDTTAAFKLPGVTAFYTAKDIPGNNSFVPKIMPILPDEEEILCSRKVKFFGQPAAIIVAKREKTANDAAKLVKIIYSSKSKNKPLLTIDQVLKSPEKDKRVKIKKTIEPAEKGNDVATVVSGKLNLEEQYHFYMETQTCVTKPTEDGMEVYSSTQWLDITNVAVAQSLKVPVNSLNVIVRRVGGGYGGKIFSGIQIACSAALVTHLLGKTCRMTLPLETNMQIIGKRFGTKCNFEVGVSTDGAIQYLRNTFYQDAGYTENNCMPDFTAMALPNCYDTKRWYIQPYSVLTDKYSNCACRAPFTTEGIAMTEYIMEKIAFKLKKDPIQVRLQNMTKEDNPIPEMITQLQKDADFDERKKVINNFNTNNRWRKRAIKILPMIMHILYQGNYTATVSIYYGDGTVAIIHGGIEMGQGLNTKAAQVCAYILGIPIEDISVKQSTSFTTPNAMGTGGSVGSESIAFAVMKACEELNKNLEPVKEKMDNPSWKDLVAKAYASGVDLQARYTFSNEDGVKPYIVYAVGMLEVEVDILTGNHDVRRVDILEDTGRSLNPEIDIAQIEGAFIMGLGYWSSEKLIHDGATGKLLTDRTWTYKVPGIKDIPADMRIYLKRGARNKHGVLQSKTTAEPPLCLSTVFSHAVREAVRSARVDAGYEDNWFDIEQPCTVENIFMAVGHKLEHFKLK